MPLVEYSHLGLGTVAIADFSSPRMKLDLTINSSGVTPNPSTGYSGTRYPGFDYRGRPNRTTWTDYGYGPGSGSNPNQPPLFLERFDYDKVNRTRRVDERVGRVWADRDAEWQFDGFDRLKLEKRGVYGAPWTYAATGFTAATSRWTRWGTG